MPGIGIGEKSGEKRTPRSGLNRPFEMGNDRRRRFEIMRSGKTPDGKGVEIQETQEKIVGWPNLLEDED